MKLKKYVGKKNKSVDSTTRRLIKMMKSGEPVDEAKVEHMMYSLFVNKEKYIEKLRAHLRDCGQELDRNPNEIMSEDLYE